MFGAFAEEREDKKEEEENVENEENKKVWKEKECMEFAYDPQNYCTEVNKESDCNSKMLSDCCDGKQICPDEWYKTNTLLLIGAPIAVTFIVIIGILAVMWCRKKKGGGKKGYRNGTGTGTTTGRTYTGTGTGTRTGTRTGR